MTPKEQKVFAKIGRKEFKNQEKNMAANTVVISYDAMFAKIGKQALQLDNLQEQLAGANRQIFALTTESSKMAKSIEAAKIDMIEKLLTIESDSGIRATLHDLLYSFKGDSSNPTDKPLLVPDKQSA